MEPLMDNEKIEVFLSSPLQTSSEKKLYWAFRRALEPYIPRIWTIGIDVPTFPEKISELEWKYISRSNAL